MTAMQLYPKGWMNLAVQKNFTTEVTIIISKGVANKNWYATLLTTMTRPSTGTVTYPRSSTSSSIKTQGIADSCEKCMMIVAVFIENWLVGSFAQVPCRQFYAYLDCTGVLSIQQHTGIAQELCTSPHVDRVVYTQLDAEQIIIQIFYYTHIWLHTFSTTTSSPAIGTWTDIWGNTAPSILTSRIAYCYEKSADWAIKYLVCVTEDYICRCTLLTPTSIPTCSAVTHSWWCTCSPILTRWIASSCIVGIKTPWLLHVTHIHQLCLTKKWLLTLCHIVSSYTGWLTLFTLGSSPVTRAWANIGTSTQSSVLAWWGTHSYKRIF